ncbi:MAG: hypothetical protein L6420_11485 [Elusimicrobia bacterium]|nr:hypothetical protein [Elusimicrobiota bacterium]
MKKNKTFALLITLIFTSSIFPFNIFVSDSKPKRFCTMNSAVQQLLNTARIPQNLQKDPVMQNIAAEIIEGKLAEYPGEFVKIEWKDVYDMRGTVNAWLAQNGHLLNHVGQAIDAFGSALTGTIVGKVIMTNTLILAGPAGFIMLGGMNVVQETFQCNPSGIVMAINAGATVVVLVPWCKVPGISKGCVSLTNGIGHGIEKIASSMFGKQITGTFLRETTNGVVVALTLKSKGKVMTAMEILNYIDGRNGRKSFRNTNFDHEDIPISIDRTQSINFDAMQNEINWDNR